MLPCQSLETNRPESVDDQGVQLAGERDRWARIRLVLKNLVCPQGHRGDDRNRGLQYGRDLRDLAECARLQALPLRKDYAEQLKWDDLCDREGLR